MQVELLQDALKRALMTAAPAVAGKSTLPVLSNVLLRATDTGMTIAATNLDIGIECKVAARVITSGAITVNYEEFSSFVSDLPNDKITLTVDVAKQEMKLVSGKHRATFKGIDADEFPTLPTVENGTSVALRAGLLQTIQARVAIATAKDKAAQLKPVLSSVHMRYHGDSAIFQAADGYRAARLTVNFDDVRIDAQDMLLHYPALEAAAKSMTGDVVLRFNDSQHSYDDGVVRVIGRGIEGRFPDVDRIIPTSHKLRIVVGSSELKRSVKLANHFAKLSANIVNISPLTDAINVAARAVESGENDNDVEAIVTGDMFTTSINATLLMEAINACGSQSIAIETESPKHPFVVRAVGDDTYMHIIMPMTVR